MKSKTKQDKVEQQTSKRELKQQHSEQKALTTDTKIQKS